MKRVQGKCLCGETVIEVDELENSVIACHCSMCRKQAAGPIFYGKAIPKKSVQFSADNYLTRYASSKEAERAFCKKCGTFIYFHENEKETLHFNIELFDDVIKHVHFEEEIFYGDKPDYYTFSNETKKEQ